MGQLLSIESRRKRIRRNNIFAGAKLCLTFGAVALTAAAITYGTLALKDAIPVIPMPDFSRAPAGTGFKSLP